MLKNKINIFLFYFIIILYAYVSNPYINKIQLGSNFSSINGVAIDSAYYYYWRYNFFNGLSPFKDFWYPYGGFFYFNSYVFPWVFIEYIFKIFLLIVIIYSIFNIFDKSKINFLYFLIFWIACIYIFKLHNFANYRYYIPLACVLYSYVSLIKNKYINNFFLSILLSTLFFLEPNLFGITLPPIIFLIIYFYMKKKLNILNFFFTSFFTFFFIILYLFYLYKNQSLVFFINFYLDLKYILLYSTFNYNFLSWFNDYNHDNLLIFSLIFIFTSAFYFLNSNVQKLNQIGSLIFSLFLMIIFLCSKQLFRPHMAWEILILCFFSIFVIILNVNNSVNIKKLFFFLNFIVLFIAIDLYKPIENRLLKHLNILNNFSIKFTSNSNLQSEKNFLDENFITINNSEINKKNNSAAHMRPEKSLQNSESLNNKNDILKLFNPNYLVVNGINGQTIVDKFYEEIPNLKVSDFFLLTDEIYLYPLFKLKPYRHATFYNTSVIKDQIELINEIRFRNPKYVFFNSDLFKKEISPAFSSDGVPSTIRNPLLYKYISQNYKFYKKILWLDILILTEFENENLSYWDDILGKNLNLGFIPLSAKSIDNKNSVCKIINNKCSYFLNIKVSTPINNNQYIVLIKNNNSLKEYKVFFTQLEKKNTYVIHLNNLWFWKIDSTPNDYTIKIKSNLDKFYINSLNYNDYRLY